VICGTSVTFCHACIHSHATKKTDLRSLLATKTRQVPTESNIRRTKHIWARRHT